LELQQEQLRQSAGSSSSSSLTMAASPTPGGDEIEAMVSELSPLERKVLAIFYSGAMSHGSISFEAHTDIAEACNRMAYALQGRDARRDPIGSLEHAGPFSNSGEGGELSVRNGTVYQSRVRQVASARFGVTGAYLAHAAELQIKVSQGAKPGIGGELPASKVTADIAAARLTTRGVRLVSPPPHHDVYSIEDLKQLIFDLRSANPRATISVKLAAADNLDVVAAGVAKAGADSISIAGSGGTGASPTTAKFGFVHDWETSLGNAHRMLTREGLRNSVKLTVSGGIQTGMDCFKALLLGADRIELGTQMLVSLGCTMAEVCHVGSCPVGIATTNQNVIDAKYRGSPVGVARVLIGTAKSLAKLLAQYGFASPHDAVGRTDLLVVHPNCPVTGLELLLQKASNPFRAFDRVPVDTGSSRTETQLISRVLNGERAPAPLIADNQCLTLGARFAFFAVRDADMQAALLAGVRCVFRGMAPGQSLGFVAPRGLTLVADYANDGTAKSLDGGSVLVRLSAGNQTGYGATSGFFAARFTGDRSFVRNSGMRALVECCGAMGANFMTGGHVTILGQPDAYEGALAPFDYRAPVLLRADAVGPNFGAGMSGGTVVMPRALHAKLRATSYLADSLRAVSPQPLTGDELGALRADIERFAETLRAEFLVDGATRDTVAERAPHSLVVALSRCSDDEWKRIGALFVKLQPSAHAYAFEFTALENFSALAERAAIQLNDGKSVPPKSGASLPSPPLSPPSPPLSPPVPPPASPGGDARPSAPPAAPPRHVDACGTGMLVDRLSVASRETVSRTLSMLERLSHRGARGIDAHSGDGCGVALFGVQDFFVAEFPSLSLARDQFAVVAVALPRERQKLSEALERLRGELARESLSVAGDRQVPTDSSQLGYVAHMQEPVVRQLIVLRPDGKSRSEFERMLTRARVRFELDEHARHLELGADAEASLRAHVISASSYHVIYKALCVEAALGRHYPDLQRIEATAGVAHSRFATNTLPRFHNVQPLGRFANNGENNGLELLVRNLEQEPSYARALGLAKIGNLDGLSDSSVMSLLMDCMFLMGASTEEIVGTTVLPYDARGSNLSVQFYNLFANIFEGPNASIVYVEDKLAVVRDKNGFRPQRGVISDRWLMSCSELGALPLPDGDVFDLPPAEPLVVNVADASFGMLQHVPDTRRALEAVTVALPSASLSSAPQPIAFGAEELSLRKRRAGWSKEVNTRIMMPLFELGKGATESMGDQGPLEAFVRGSQFDLFGFFKGKFSQVTNPPLARNEEQVYMSTETFVGSMPTIEAVLAGAKAGSLPPARGLFFASPVLDNVQMALLVAHKPFNTTVIDITYELALYENGLLQSIERVTRACLEAVERGSQLLVLSDLATSETRASIPPVLVCSIVDKSMREAGLRRRASIALQASAVLSGVHIAQALSIGGADVVNPYLVFCRDAALEASQFDESRHNYLKSVRQEVLGHMARMGISSLSAYRGAKGFSAIGIDATLADLYGVRSELGGLGLQDVSRILLTNHRFISEEGLGKHVWIDQVARTRHWNARFTNAFIRAARGESSFEAMQGTEAQLDLLKMGQPRGWLQLLRPAVYTASNPLVVCILGGGAAGFYQAQSLLERRMPVRVVIIERQHVNQLGLIGGGIAPDHAATKNQSRVLRELLKDPRVQYYGGIDITDERIEEMRQKYPVVVDCRGASEDVRLGVPGEEPSQGVLPASRVYLAYNNVFSPTAQLDWPFTFKSKNPVLGVVGGGNVACDIARIFLKEASDLRRFSINPVFLSYLQHEGPRVVRLFVRSDPSKIKMSFKELEELRGTGVWMSALFDPINDIDRLSEEQRRIYEFFLKIKDRKHAGTDTKRIYFHFSTTPLSFRRIGNEVEAEFKMGNGQLELFRASNFVTALGKRKPAAVPGLYAAGWSTGSGGTLSLAENSALSTAAQIERDFFARKFDEHRGDAQKDEEWQLRAVSNIEALGILKWCDEGRELRTVEHFRNARLYWSEPKATPPPSLNLFAAPQQADAPGAAVVASSDGVTVIDGNGSVVLKGAADSSLLSLLKQKFAGRVQAECDGQLTCGVCAVEVTAGTVQRSRKEISLLTANEFDARTHILTCAHQFDKLAGCVVRLKKQ
jgi:glutamate synthase domain-containing protein 2/glutamate synthase domain-containing protein 1/glutamate synthase domain-containing protein 3/ferredoxin